jgi:hypothetical protein
MGYGAAKSAQGTVAQARGQTTKVVRCESCGQNYSYELKRTGHGKAPGVVSSRAHSLANERAEEDLRRKLVKGIEAIPCPACGWYQSGMIAKARRRHRRGMLYVGQCLTLGVFPVAAIGLLINSEDKASPPIPWPIFVAGLVCLLAVGVVLLIWRHNLTRRYDPNEEDVEARKRYGQARATLLSKQEAQDVLAHAAAQDRPQSTDGMGATDARSNAARTEPQASEPIAGECLGGCVFLLLLIAAGVGYWNYWKGEKEREVRAKLHMMENRPMPPWDPDWGKRMQEQAKQMDELRKAMENRNR